MRSRPALHVEEGDTVERGDVLAEIDPTLARAKLVEAEATVDKLKADLAAEQARLAQAKSSIDRLGILAGKDIVSKAEMDIAIAQHAVSKAATLSIAAEIRQAQAILETARANMNYTKIVAPIAGTVITILAREGQTLNANNEAPVILKIADLDTMRVEAEVSEADIGRLEAGQAAYFTVLGRPDMRWEGRLEQVLPEPIIDNHVVFYRALFEVPNPDRHLMSQMTAQIFFILERAENRPIVPLSALSASGRDGSSDSVRVVAPDGSFDLRDVRLGVRDETHAAIVDGLVDGETIVASGSAQ